MCVLDMDENGDLYFNKFVLLCKNEIIKRLINGSYHLAEPSQGPGTIGNSLIKLFSWHEGDLHHFPHVHNTKISLKQKGIFQKGKHRFFIILNSLPNKQQLFLTLLAL